MIYALDANTLIYYFKGMGRVAQHLLSVPPSEITIPAPVLYELETGLALSDAPDKRRKLLQALLADVKVLPLDESAARSAARVRAELQRAGKMIGPVDILIAGIAISTGAILVTRNRREFQRVTGLRTVDWY